MWCRAHPSSQRRQVSKVWLIPVSPTPRLSAPRRIACRCLEATPRPCRAGSRLRSSPRTPLPRISGKRSSTSTTCANTAKLCRQPSRWRCPRSQSVQGLRCIAARRRRRRPSPGPTRKQSQNACCLPLSGFLCEEGARARLEPPQAVPAGLHAISGCDASMRLCTCVYAAIRCTGVCTVSEYMR